jgi:hypothetical protein
MYVQISLVTGSHEQPSTTSIYRTRQLRSRERQISNEISTRMTYCEVMWTNVFVLPQKAGKQAHGASPTSYTSTNHKISECFLAPFQGLRN